MKKTYIQPETIVVRLQTEGMIAASSLEIKSGSVDTSSEGGQLTNKKGSSIWGDEEQEGGMW